MCHSKLFTYEYTAAFVLSFLYHLSLLYCHYCSVMHVTVMPVSAYMALAFVFGFIPNKLMMMMMICVVLSLRYELTDDERARTFI